jgi:hypothetical protein
MAEGIISGVGIDDMTNGLVAVTEDGGAIHTGIGRGHVQVDAEAFDSEPKLDTDGWDEVVDVSFVSTEGVAVLGSLEQATDFNIAFNGPGTYRIRVHARGRDDNPDARKRRTRPRKGSLTEAYLIHVWPAPAAEETVHKATDQRGAVLRARLAKIQGRYSLDELSDPVKLFVTEGQFYVRDPEADTEPVVGDGVLSVAEDWALVSTGINTGHVMVTTHAADFDPEADAAPWEEIEEAVLKSTTGILQVDAIEGCDDDRNLAGDRPGTYRIRVHARGRSVNPDGVQDDEDPIAEHYLIQVWPAHKGPKRPRG